MRSKPLNLENWLALAHCSGVGPQRFQQYLQFDPLLQALPANLQPDYVGVERDLKWLATQPDAQILTLNDPAYPQLLKHIADPPPLLYAVGDVAALNQPQLAIVGSRQCSSRGKQQATAIAERFADLGITITSGLAIGIDAASHKGALAAKQGRTIAVLAHGLDSVYPQQHKILAAQIAAQGCLLSELPIGVIPLPHTFPRRNRLISGLSLGVLIVEANINSGSLITARCALEQNREVFAMPGPVNLPTARGCHQLIKQGAKLVESEEDVLEELETLLNCAIRDKYADSMPVPAPTVRLSARQQQILEFIDYDSTCVDVIVERTGLASSAIGASLLELELQGVITAVPGGYARKLD